MSVSIVQPISGIYKSDPALTCCALISPQMNSEVLQAISGKLSHALGEVGELYVRMVMRGFDRQEIDGMDYFGHADTVLLPKFESIERRGGILLAGEPVEIDVIAEWRLTESDLAENDQKDTRGAWLVEAKYTQEKIGKAVVAHFLSQAKRFSTQANYAVITHWFFSKSGFTEGAIALLKEAGVFYSDWDRFYRLARHLGFLGLPQ